MAHPGGRPTKYNEKYHVPWARGLAMRGATMEQIAEEFEIAMSTLYEWRDKHPEFREALNSSREKADMGVERSLYERAMGGRSKETKKVIRVVDGQPVVERIEEVERELAPDTTACIFWLKNRNPKLWRDRQDIQVNESDDAAIKEFIGALGLGGQDADVQP